ncbi:MAG TPA: hypothetical protein PKW55_00005, partial [Spirochaetota bacterium]|nr:hypothetical protein [Spirochaetota bacterium]HPQ49383.1 hypothetical protein [Spirochaetota bacterium]
GVEEVVPVGEEMIEKEVEEINEVPVSENLSEMEEIKTEIEEPTKQIVSEEEEFFEESIKIEEEVEKVDLGDKKYLEKKEDKSEIKEGKYKELNVDDVKKVLSYLDTLFGYLPEDKIKDFAKSEYYDLYNKLFDELGI